MLVTPGLISLQAMMGFPIVMVFVLFIGFSATYFIISVINLLNKTSENTGTKRIKPFWYSVLGAFLLLGWFGEPSGWGLSSSVV